MSKNAFGKINLEYRDEIINSQNHLLSGSPMLIITNLDNLQTEYINKSSFLYLGLEPDDFKRNNASCIFQKIIHPTDYPGFWNISLV